MWLKNHTSESVYIYMKLLYTIFVWWQFYYSHQ